MADNLEKRPNVGIFEVAKNVGVGIFNRTLGRLTGAGLQKDSLIVRAGAKWSGRGGQKDWRVRLTLPAQSNLRDVLLSGEITRPLRDSNGIFWPLTPSMIIQHSANYNALSQTHSNYPFQAYQNSQVDQMNIIGEFPVQNQDDAKYWVAVVNFLRTASKMFFGNDDGDGLKGNPPPILHLTGYGDHMFNKVPVVIQSFNIELRGDIDYISTQQSNVYSKQIDHDLSYDYANEDATWAPTLSNISCQLQPIYSRDSVKNFSMQKFVRGELNGKGNEVGLI